MFNFNNQWKLVVIKLSTLISDSGDMKISSVQDNTIHNNFPTTTLIMTIK